MLTARGKVLYCVHVTRTQEAEVLVLAGSEAEAVEDAEELVGDNFDTDDTDSYAHLAQSVGDSVSVWTGGPDGEDKRWEELREG